MTEQIVGEFGYPGSELALFAHAVNWKRYMAKALAPFISGVVAEVGAGIGETTRVLQDAPHTKWLAIEPDRALADSIAAKVALGTLKADVRPVVGTLATIDADQRFDTILYVDVLEHIEDDRAELALAATRLKPGGRIVVLSPAYQTLFSEFDSAIGHFRRYDAAGLKSVAGAELRVSACFYLDSVGVLASFANKAMLRQSSPTPSQIRLWDRAMVPVSRLVDPLIGRRFGRSVVVVWERSDRAA